MYEATFPVISLEQTGKNIVRLRRAAGLSVRDLQDYFGFEYPQAIYKWQHGECLPTVDNLLALARLLRVSIEDLLVLEGQEASSILASAQQIAEQTHMPPKRIGNVRARSPFHAFWGFALFPAIYHQCAQIVRIKYSRSGNA